MKKISLTFFLFVAVILSGCNNKAVTTQLTPTPTPEVKLLQPGEGPEVDLSARADKQAVILKISSISATIKKIDYEIVYDTNGVQRGVLGSLDIKEGQTKILKEILLASCSKNVCVYDKNVSKLQLTMKFTGDGEPLEFQKEYPL